jgi:transcriptional regulator with XRE-family HTH domain
MGETLRKARLRHREAFTLEDMAARVGVSTGMIGNVETGVARPSEETLRKWLEVLDLPQVWADEFIEYQIGEKVRELLEGRRGPRAPSKEDVDAAVRYVRRLFGR